MLNKRPILLAYQAQIGPENPQLGYIFLQFSQYCRLDSKIHYSTHEIAQNCVCNAQKSFAAGAYNAPPNSLVGWGGGPLPRPLPHAFGVSLRRSPVCPSQNNFLDPPLYMHTQNVHLTFSKQHRQMHHGNFFR